MFLLFHYLNVCFPPAAGGLTTISSSSDFTHYCFAEIEQRFTYLCDGSHTLKFRILGDDLTLMEIR